MSSMEREKRVVRPGREGAQNHAWRLLVPLFLPLALLFVGTAGRAAPRQPAAVDALFFQERVRPLLARRCVGCHGGAGAQAGLDLSTRAGLLKSRAVRPGSSRNSLLVRRVAAGTMPPKEKLPAAEVALLRRWVDAGLPWSGGPVEPHAGTTAHRAGLDWWSLQPLRPADRHASIDGFIEERLRQAGLGFSPPAARAAYLRRVTYDLHGLPPTPEEIAAFVSDRRPEAFERLVDRLLASPRYGERFARRWLDAVRFAESDGYEHDMPRLNAWPYRDWVIEAFNADMRYDRFVREQLAGDALHPGDPRGGIPTGFLVAGCFDSVGAAQAAANFKAEVRQDELEDLVGTTTQVFLGMSAQCARCHDHKFDPIPQRDYYRLQAALAGAWHQPAQSKEQYHAVRSVPPPPVWLLQRGQVTARGPEVTPGALSALRMLSPELTPAPDGDPARRRKLAEWITDPRNPLPPRVLVNRVWGWLFGQGIVTTPNDFGFNGERPSHPELLDWLAGTFASPRGLGGSAKGLVRMIVLSRTYRQSSAFSPAAAAKDAGNRLLWSHSPRRLEAEELRDTLLMAAGRLNLRMGGPGFQLFTWKVNAGALYEAADPDGDEYCRRAVYRMVVRGIEHPLIAGLDCPDPSATTPRRQATTTATQALSLLNNAFVARQSERFAARLRRAAGTESPEAAVRASYRIALGREPEPAELRRAAAFAERHGLAAWCRVLFNTSELLSVE